VHPAAVAQAEHPAAAIDVRPRPGLVDRDTHGRPVAQPGLHPGKQLVEGKRLSQVVARAGVQRPHLRVGTRSRGEDEHGQARVKVKGVVEHPEAVVVGKHQVEDQEIPLLCGEPRDCAVRAVRDRCVVPLRLEAACDEAGDQRLVLDQQDPHLGASIPDPGVGSAPRQ